MRLAVSSVVGTFVLVLAALVPVASASTAPVVGTFSIADHGQGGWGGGALLADGSISGGGAFAFGNGANVGTITGVSWSPAGPGAVSLCFAETVTKGQALFPPGCSIFPVTGTPIVISEGPGDVTTIRVTLN